jgi:hypothetical protein
MLLPSAHCHVCCPPRARWSADEASALAGWRETDKVALRHLFDVLQVITTQDESAHIVLATADPFFLDLLTASECVRQRRARLLSARAAPVSWHARRRR